MPHTRNAIATTPMIVGLASLVFVGTACARGPATRQGVNASEAETTAFRASLRQRAFHADTKIECTTAPVDARLTSRVCARSFYDGTDTSAEVAVLADAGPTPVVATTVAVGRYLSSDLDVAVDVRGGTAYVAWVTRDSRTSTPTVAVHLRKLDLASGQTLVDRVVLEAGWGIDRLAIARHPAADLLLFACNDLSAKNADNLRLGALRLDQLADARTALRLASVNASDPGEKGFPRFVVDGQRLFLHHKTGETWGLAAYSGAPAVAIAEVDGAGTLRGYTVVAEAGGVNNEVSVRDGVVFYEHVVGTNHGTWELKKLDFEPRRP